MNRSVIAAAILGLLAAMPLALHAQDGKKEGSEGTRNCLSISHIDRIEVVDDQTMIFHMHGDKKYINVLPYKCHGLKNRSFIHETSLNSYCDLDIISVLDVHLGMRLGSCPLGDFRPYTAPEKPEGDRPS